MQHGFVRAIVLISKAKAEFLGLDGVYAQIHCPETTLSFNCDAAWIAVNVRN